MSALRERTREITDKTKEFLEGIKPTDNVGLIFHDDLDGFASARLFHEFLIKKGCNNIEAGVFVIGKINPFGLEEIKRTDKLIVLDLGPNLVSFDLSKDKKPTLYIDHHPRDESLILEDNIIEIRTISGIPVSRTAYRILEEYVTSLDWLALAGTLFDRGDKFQENIPFIRDVLIKNSLRLNDFNQNVVYALTSFIIYFEDNLRKAFSIMESIKTIQDIDKIKRYSEPIEREIERFVNLFDQEKKSFNGIDFFYFEPKFAVKSIVTSKISFENPDGVFVFATPEEKIIRFSARNQSKTTDVAELLKRLVEGFDGATAGGHSASAGGAIRKEDLPRFLERLKYAKL